MISVYITCKDMAEAKKIARHLLQNRLIACANMFAVESMFRWKREVNDVKEVAMLCKAKKGSFKKIEEEVKKLHSYEVPCIVAFSLADSGRDFSEWVEKGYD